MTQEINALIRDVITERTTNAMQCMKNLESCKALIEEIHKEGYVEQAKTLSNIIFLNALVHPEWNDDDMIDNIYKQMYNK